MNVFDLIANFLKPIEGLLRDEEVSEIMVNADGAVWIECNGVLLQQPIGQRIEQDALTSAARMIARELDKEFDSGHPMLEARLPDGSRVTASRPPASPDGTILSIRKFRARRFTADELVARGMLTEEMLGWLIDAIEQERATILISGGTGTGKTSLLNALAAYMPIQDRVVLIEDTSEIVIGHANLVRLEARKGEAPAGRLTAGNAFADPDVTVRDLLRHALRLRPDRVILGEVRGPEAFDLLQTLNTGHSGTLSTIHANTAALALSRLRTCVAMAGVGLPDEAVARNIAEVVNVVVHIERRAGMRRVAEIARVRAFTNGQFVLEDWRSVSAPEKWRLAQVDVPPAIVGAAAIVGKKPAVGAPDDD